MNDARCSVPDAARSQDTLADLVAAGARALDEGDLREALSHYEAVITAFPDRPEGHNNLGALYASLCEFARAETCFDRVVALVPGNPHVLYNRGVMRSRLGKHAAAGADFAAALVLAPNDPDLHNNLGVATHQLGDAAGARRHLEAALRLRPDYANALLNLCDIDEACDDLASAIDRCEKYLASHQDNEIRRRQFALHGAAARSHLDKACAAAEALLVTHPDDQKIRRELGRLIQARQSLTEMASQAAAGA